MPATIETYDLTQILQPFQNPEDARQDAMPFGAGLTVKAGQAVGKKTSDNLCYPLNNGKTVNAGTNEVQTVTTTGTTSAGAMTIALPGTGIETGPIAYNAILSAIQTALDTAFGASQIIAGGTVNALTLTFSGSTYLKAPQPAVVIDDNRTGSTGTAVVRTTPGVVASTVPASDGTQNCVGFSMYSFITDANGKIFYGPSAVASVRTGPWTTSAVWVKGIFHPSDLLTAITAVSEVDTFTPTTVTTGDVNTLTSTANDGTTTAVSVTIGATATATAASGLLITAWNANPSLSAIATASGTTTVVLTAVALGGSLTVAGSVVGTGTLPKATTTAAANRALSDILPSIPGARLLANGAWDIP